MTHTRTFTPSAASRRPRLRATRRKPRGRSRASEESVDWLALDAALKKLEAHDQDLAELVSLRYFAGLSVDQAAAALGVAPRTIDRNWRLARAFLQRELIDGAGE